MFEYGNAKIEECEMLLCTG